MESKNLDISEIKKSFDTLSNYFSAVEVNKGLTIDKEQETSITNAYANLSRLLEESETKSYQLANELSDPAMYGVWSQEERSFIDRVTLKNLFQDENWVFVVVDLIATKISAHPLKVYRKIVQGDKTTIEEASNHPYNEILQNPNNEQSQMEYIYCQLVDLVLVGESYTWTGINYQSLYHFPAETMDPDIDVNGRVIKYYKYPSIDEYQMHASSGTYPADQIILAKKPHPSSIYRGFSPFIPARRPVLFNRLSTEYLNNFYLKGAVGGVFLELDKDQNFNNILRLIRSYESAYSGRSAARRSKVLPPGVKVNAVSETLAEQTLKEHLQMNKEDILAILKVPKHEVGLQTAGSLGSEEYKTALKNFWESTLIPYSKLQTQKMSKSLKPVLGPGYYLDFDFSKVEVLQENESAKADLGQKLLATHTLNEVREKIWQDPPLPGGDEKPGAMPGSFLPQGQFSQNSDMTDNDPKKDPFVVDDNVSSRTQEEEFETTKTISPGEYESQAVELIKSAPDWFSSRVKMIDEEMQPPIDEVTKLFLDMFSKQGIALIKKINLITKTKALDLEDEESIKKEIDKSLKEVSASLKGGYKKAYKDRLEQMARGAFDHPYYQNEQKTIDKVISDSKQQLANYLNHRQNWIFDKVDETTSKAMYNVIQNSAKSSDTITEMSRKIADWFSSPEKMLWRAERIGRTETLTAMSKSQAIAAKNAQKYFPDLKKMWISTFDDRTRGNPSGRYPIPKKGPYADHWHMHGQIKSEDEDFEDKHNNDYLSFPRDPRGKANSVINCRCTHVVLPAKEMAKFSKTEREAQPNA